MNIEEKRRKQREATARWRKRNPEKVLSYAKTYRSRPEYKKEHRDRQKRWRLKNYDKALAINRKCWNKHKERRNEDRKNKYHNDPKYRAKKQLSDKRYGISGKRKSAWDRNPNKPTILKRRWQRVLADPVRRNHRRKYNRQYRVEIQRGKEEAWRKNLSDEYVTAVIRKQLKHQIKTKDIPYKLIEAKRSVLKIKRTIKEKKP